MAGVPGENAGGGESDAGRGKPLVALLNRFPGKTAAWDLAVWADLQKSDDAGAAAAMEAPRRLDSADDGRMRELSRMCWKTVGDIACQLRRYEESYEAYQHAAALSDASEIRLKAGYVLMKWDRPDKAGGYFREALDRFPQDSSIVREAHRYLAYIDHLQKIKNSEQPEKP